MKVTIETAVLSRTLKNAMLFAAKDDSRPVLECIRITATKEEVVFEVTDSYAILRQTVAVETSRAPQDGETVFVHRDEAEELVARLKFIERRQKADLSRGEVPRTTFTVKVGDGITPYIFELDACSNFGYGNHIDWPNTKHLWTTNPGVAGVKDTAVAGWFHQKVGKIQLEGKRTSWDLQPLVMRVGETELKPVYFTFHGTQIEGLVMPVRIKE